MTTDLSNFGVDVGSPPTVERRACVQSPHTGKLCGFLGRDVAHDRTVYATRRGGWHYYREGDGYAISDAILDRAETAEVSRIVVYENPDDDEVGETVYEFQPHAYRREGEAVPDDYLVDPDDTQTYVPLASAIAEWPDYAEDLFARSFEAAMDAIDWRGFNPDHPARDDA